LSKTAISIRAEVREQIDWWRECSDITPAEAMTALGLECDEATWGEVALVAEARLQGMRIAGEMCATGDDDVECSMQDTMIATEYLGYRYVA
jgi:hypothetical protein